MITLRGSKHAYLGGNSAQFYRYVPTRVTYPDNEDSLSLVACRVPEVVRVQDLALKPDWRERD
ncbi:hypothetical protein DPMN_151986 [Dreissena polymorpha]|uniref:Uncharacterized protein n=1 Tax=Dreissena polymorpha TaxID=45954 RepID=A0A9D4FHH6_DREPO|nr:hypothetical protein DPMN_151986 [Dreissena polymorpha]